MKKESGNQHSKFKNPSMQGSLDIGGNKSVIDGQKDGWLEKQQAYGSINRIYPGSARQGLN